MLKVLVAPLDWGLGHATRCIPIIKELINQRCTIIIAAGGAQKAVLQEEFPDLSFVEIPGFRLKYGKNRASTLLKIIFAIPKILIGIKRENDWLKRFSALEGLDLVISDNRYGLSLTGVDTVFMTHQLAVKSSFGRTVDWLLRQVNYSHIRRFSVCWVPDMADPGGLAGVLAHPRKMPGMPVRYIGWLSRLRKEDVENEYELLVLLSGPEPQRTILEEMVLEQLEECMGRVALVRGLPGGGGKEKAARQGAAPTPEITIFDYLGARDLSRVISQSNVVLARSGYSTVMDLVRLRRKAVYVPTPGQPEQEYLGKYLAGQGLGVCAGQRGFVLKKALEQAARLEMKWPGETEGLLGAEIRRVLASVSGC